MNLTSVITGVAIMGMAAPMIMEVSLAPVIAEKRASNFAIAESQAVVFAAKAENQEQVPPNTDACKTQALGEGAYSVACTHGLNQFRQVVTRSFRLMPEAPVKSGEDYTNPFREFAFETPTFYSHVECPPDDPWGVMWYNAHLKAGNMHACRPAVTWTEERFLESNPDDWLYDLSEHGYGWHPDY